MLLNLLDRDEGRMMTINVFLGVKMDKQLVKRALYLHVS
jgi:hypothetical protein